MNYRLVCRKFLLVTISFLIASPCFGGAQSGGGGSTISFAGRAPFLLDRLNLHLELATSKKPVDGLPRLSSEKQPEFGPLLASDEAPFQRALEILNGWYLILPRRDKAARSRQSFKSKEEQDKAELSEFVIRVMENLENGLPEFRNRPGMSLPYMRTTHTFATHQYYLPPEVQNLNYVIQTAILYTEEYGSVISGAAFDILDLETQAQLLIHESIRQLQFAYHFTMDNKSLQDLTALLLEPPQADKAHRILASMPPTLIGYIQLACGISSEGGLVPNDDLTISFYNIFARAAISKQLKKRNALLNGETGTSEFQKAINEAGAELLK